MPQRTASRAGCVLLLLGTALSAPLSAATPKELWEAVRTATLDPARAVSVEKLEIDLERAVLHLERGVLVPARAIDGRTTELVFVGEARFFMRAPDDLERSQLELFTDREELDVTVDRAVLALGNRAIADKLLGREPITALDATVAVQAGEVFQAWVAGAERRGFGADAAAWQSLLGDEAYQQFFVVWCRSAEVGEFYYRLDLTESEQVTLGQFKPIEAGDMEEHRIRRAIQRSQREGRSRALRFEDLGDWDTWISAPLSGPDGRAAPGKTGFESESYVLDVKLDPAQEGLEGTARVLIRCERAGRRAVPLTLSSDLVVRAVEDDAGRALPWVRSQDDLYVPLESSPGKGERMTLVVRWGGKAFLEVDKGVLALASTGHWYPRVGDIDRATYEATLRWPKGKQVLAGGRVVESGTEGNERWERRRLEMPAIAFSLEIGDCDVRQAKAGHVDLTVGFCEVPGDVHHDVDEEIITTLQEALAFLEERYGPYPLDYLTVVTVQRGFSQGFLGFVSLSNLILRGGKEFVEGRRETISHELSHQWWGNQVGWFSYRDQWLSEALADFSAMLFAAHKAQREAIYLATHAQGWRSALERRARSGRPVESLGPVVLGQRLNSSQSGRAYQAVVYDKGSVVFNMLARALGPEPFTQMLRELVAAVHNRVIDTATFLAAIERMSGVELDDFASRFIYGTGLAEVYYTYHFARDGERWVVDGEARQVTKGRSEYTLHRTEAGHWDVTHQYHADVAIDRSMLVVPFQVSLVGAKSETTKWQLLPLPDTTTQMGLGGNMILRGEATPIHVVIDPQPESFWLDQRGEVLATFRSEQREPKRFLRYRALEAARAGRHDEAQALYRQALEAPLLAPEIVEKRPSKRDEEHDSREENAAIHVGLAALFLDQGRDAAAIEALDQSDRLSSGEETEDFFFRWLYDERTDYPFWRKLLRARVASRAGDYAEAYDLLSKLLYLNFPQREGETLADVTRRQRFRSEDRMVGNGRDYALLAAAAWEQGHKDVARQAAKAAAERDANVAALSMK